KIDVLAVFLAAPATDDTARKLARDFIPRLAAMEPPNGEALMLYGAILEADSLDRQAASQYKKALLADSSLQPAWHRLIVLLSTESPTDTLKLYTEQAASLFPENPVFLYFNGYAALLQKQYPTAISNFENCLAYVPGEDTSLRAQVYGILGDAYQEVK